MKELDDLLLAQNNTFEKLNTLSKNANQQEEKLNALRKKLWKKMFKDIYSLKKYFNKNEYLDTGIPFYRNEKDYSTIGFLIDENDNTKISIYQIFHKNNLKDVAYKDKYWGSIEKDKPFDTYSNSAIYNKIEKLLFNWDKVFEKIKINLKKEIKRNIKKNNKEILYFEKKELYVFNKIDKYQNIINNK